MGYALGGEGKAERGRRDIPHSSLDRRSPRIDEDVCIVVVGDIGVAVVGDIGIVVGDIGVTPEGIADVPEGIGIIGGDMDDVRGLMGTPVSVWGPRWASVIGAESGCVLGLPPELVLVTLCFLLVSESCQELSEERGSGWRG